MRPVVIKRKCPAQKDICKTINLVEDCGIKKGPPQAYGDEEMQVAVKAIVDAIKSSE